MDLTLRDDVQPTDAAAVRGIVLATGMFHDYEVDVAVELVEERLARGPASGYFFVIAERAGQVIGYTCYGPIACTAGSFDLYWIAVRPDCQGQGLGRALLAASEERIAASAGRLIYIETSCRPQYAPTRAFYERCGYRLEATLRDFYAPGDDKAIYVRSVRSGWPRSSGPGGAIATNESMS